MTSKFAVFSALILAVGLMTSCASNTDKLLEEAQFHLDRGEFEQAATKAQEALDADADNDQAKFLLASALFGRGVIGEGGSLLNPLAETQESIDDGDSKLTAYDNLAEGLTGTGLEDLQAARDFILDIPESVRDENKELWFWLYVMRTFEISAAINEIGAGNPDDECNANPANPNTDGIPDDFEPDGLSDSEAERFNDNMENVDSDGERAGLPSDFAISESIRDLFSDLNDRIDAAGNLADGLEDFFIDQFGDPDNEALCTN